MMRRDSCDDIAIVGVSCRLPGGIDSAESLWDFVAAGSHVSSDFPPDRPLPDLIGFAVPEGAESFAPKGGFIEDPGMFDAEFFGISPREAKAMDPQQRIALELCWNSLENASLNPQQLRGSRTGVYIGAMAGDYAYLAVGRQDLDPGYIATGSAQSVLSGRVSYLFGFEGPSMTIDTACSSSLVSVHVASQALRSGECSLALAGGVTIMSTLASFFALGQHGAVSRDGRSKAYSCDADGFCVAEGGAVLVLERLSDALENRHRILGILRGSAVNQDGASNGLTAPSATAQRKVIDAALMSAGLTAAEVDVVEGHGTGTPVGDPLELEALFASYGQERPENSPLLLGSLKSNLGHTQAAAGVAGIIKMIEAMRRGIVPASLHVTEPTSSVDWSAGAVEVVTESRQWPGNARPRRCGVSSFGIGGTNAHVILEQAPPVATDTGAVPPKTPDDAIWVVSGRTAAARSRRAANLLAHLKDHPELGIHEVAYTLATARATFDFRAAVVGADPAEMLDGLAKIADNQPYRSIRGIAMDHKVVFVFPGQGSHYLGMGARLMAESRVFAEHIRACDAALGEFVDWSLVDTISAAPGGADINRSDVVQPLVFAIMTGLATLWQSVGVQPDAVIGHSQGEVAAACVAGALSLRDATRIIALRSRIVNKLSGTGAMASVNASADAVEELLAGLDDIGIAAVNAARTTVVSGAPAAVDALSARCQDAGIRFRMIEVDYASHSSHFDSFRAELETAVAGITPRETDIKIFSTVSGDTISPLDLDAEYWFRNVRETVLFSDAVESAYLSGYSAFLEMRLHPVLTAAMHEAFEDMGADTDLVFATGTATREDDGMHGFLTAVANAYVRGVVPDWAKLYGDTAMSAVELPGYAFEREVYWLASGGKIHGGSPSAYGLADPDHPLLSAISEVPGTDQRLFSTRIALSDHPWLADHALHGNVLVPGAMLLEMALHAGHRVGSAAVEKLTMHTPIVVPQTGAVQIQLLVGESVKQGQRAISVYSRPEAEKSASSAPLYTLHADGLLSSKADGSADNSAMEFWPPAGAGQGLDIAEYYQVFTALGYQYGPTFQGMKNVWRRGEEILAEIMLPDSVGDADKYGLHPALLDAAMQTMIAAVELTGVNGGLALPYRWENVSLFAVGARALRVRMTPGGPGRMRWLLCDNNGRTVATGALVVRAFASRKLVEQHMSDSGESLFRMDWTRLSVAPVRHTTGTWAVIGGEAAADTLAKRHAIPVYTDIEALRTTLEQGGPAPSAAIWPVGACVAATVRDRLVAVLRQLQEWLATEALANTKLILLTSGTHAFGNTRVEVDPAGAAIWGLVRSAQSENPGRIVQIDADATPSLDMIAAAVQSDEPELVIRDGQFHGRRILADVADSVRSGQRLMSPWSLRIPSTGNLDDAAIVEDHSERDGALTPGSVVVDLRAAGITFPMVLAGLDRSEGMFSRVLHEAAGVVRAVAPDVTSLVVGDHVFGLFEDIRSTATTDHRLLAKKPVSLSFAEAATAPISFLTAAYALRAAEPTVGETILVHCAAGGVGMAAVQLARRLGLTILATASPQKWQTLRDMGIGADRIASSRSHEFAQQLDRGHAGIDIVLNMLPAEFTQDSLELLSAQGRFIEIGRAQVLDPSAVTRDGRTIEYTSFELGLLDPADIQDLLSELSAAFDAGELAALPLKCFDIRQAGTALRYCAEPYRVGKVALTWPRAFDPEQTVLITGGTGAIGKLVATHLVKRYGARHLVITSRSGAAAPDVAAFAEEMTAVGVEITIEACDVTDRSALESVLGRIPDQHRLGAVIHLAAALADATIPSLTPGHIDAVLPPKAFGADHLHELTTGSDLSMFVLFSSAAGSFGAPGQANYAAANTYVDALAQRRYHRGLPATSMAWGWWAEVSGNTSALDEQDRSRLTRLGIVPMTSAAAMRMFDSAIETGLPYLVPIGMNLGLLRAAAAVTELPPLFRSLLNLRPRATQHVNGPGDLAKRLAGLTPEQQHVTLVDLLMPAVSMVLGYSSASEMTPDHELLEMGIDSLSSIELGTHLRAITGLKLSNSVIFEYPTVNLLARHILAQLAPSDIELAEPLVAQIEALVSRLAAIHGEAPLPPEVIDRLSVSLGAIRIGELEEIARNATETVGS
ncbi:type I polyketide synthase [Nocardia sp. Marseille-Q1738]